MKHTTHKLTPEQKEKLFTEYQDLIYMIFCCGGYMLRRQIRILFYLLTGRNEKDTEFDTVELILTGFLLQKTINKDTRTQMLYLSKYPKSKFLDVENSGDVPSINWSNQKIFEQIFKVDYLIGKVIPDMNKKNFNLDIDNIQNYLQWNGSNLLLSNNQVNMVDFYNLVWNAFIEKQYTLTDEFFRDIEIAQYDKDCFEANQLKKDKEVAPCMAKIQRDKERDSYTSEIDRNKQFYSLKNFASHGFYIESIGYNIINICYFDSMNTIQTKKLYQQLGYILLMFQRYTNNYNISIHTTVYVWDNEKAEHLKEEEIKSAFDFYRQEWVDENKRNMILKNIGILPSQWNSISVNYKSMDIFTKYNVHL